MPLSAALSWASLTLSPSPRGPALLDKVPVGGMNYHGRVRTDTHHPTVRRICTGTWAWMCMRWLVVPHHDGTLGWCHAFVGALHHPGRLAG